MKIVAQIVLVTKTRVNLKTFKELNFLFYFPVFFLCYGLFYLLNYVLIYIFLLPETI